MTENRSLIVFSQTRQWGAAIRRNFDTHHIIPILNIEDLWRESQISHAQSAIIEVNEKNIHPICLSVSRFINSPNLPKLYAVGNGGSLGWEPLLRSSGFVAWYWLFSQIPSLCRVIANQPTSHVPPTRTLESRISASLPWATARTDHQT